MPFLYLVPDKGCTGSGVREVGRPLDGRGECW